jgi:hypothetical protein
MATLGAVINQLEINRQENKDSLDRLNFQMKSFIDMFKMQQLDMLEALREQREKTRVAAAGSGGGAGASGMNFNLPPALAGILASLGAVGGALAGLRGWEASALKNIDKIGKGLKALVPTSLIKQIDQKFINVRASILRTFGLDPSLGKADDAGKRTLRTPILEQINNRFNRLRVSILNQFGIGADGKAIVTQGADGKFRVPVAGRITSAIQDLISPVLKLAEGIGSFIKGAGAPLFGFLKSFGIATGGAIAAAGGAVGGVAKLAGKILLPLGILFSAYDAFKTWQEGEGDPMMKRIADTGFAFLGDFIGAPLDLLKSGIVYLYRNVMGLEVDEEGKITGDGFAAAIGRVLQDFSFEDAIKAIPDFFQSVFDSIAAFFKDPVGVGSQVISNLYDSIKQMFMGILRSIVSAIPGGRTLFPGLFETKYDAEIETREGMKKDLSRQMRSATQEFNRANRDASFTEREIRNTRAEIARVEEFIATKNYKGGDGTARYGRTRAEMEEDLAELYSDLDTSLAQRGQDQLRINAASNKVFGIANAQSNNELALAQARRNREDSLNVTPISVDQSNTNVDASTSAVMTTEATSTDVNRKD